MSATCNNISSTSSSLDTAPSVTHSSTYTIIVNNLYNKEVYIWADIPCDGYNGEYLTVRVKTISGWESYKGIYNLTNGQYYSVITAYSVETDNKVIAVEMVFSNVPNGANYIELGYYTYEDPTDYTYYWKIVEPNPTITAQPTISSINPTSGASTTITWSTATVSNQGNSTIYYQYFVGPNSTYSDSYHIGTTTGTSATITEAQIISKCGNGFGASSSGSTCYLFVRAYWDNGSAQGGWVVPTGTTFIYYPTINAPTNFSITPTTGSSTVLKWNNTKAGNNSDSQIILYIDNNQVASGIQGSNSGYTIGEDVWKTLGEGNHAIKIAHEYYGRYAYTSSLTFTYKKPYQTISYYTNGNFVPCKVFYYTNNEWRLCNINYYTDGSWKPCSTT